MSGTHFVNNSIYYTITTITVTVTRDNNYNYETIIIVIGTLFYRKGVNYLVHSMAWSGLAQCRPSSVTHFAISLMTFEASTAVAR